MCGHEDNPLDCWSRRDSPIHGCPAGLSAGPGDNSPSTGPSVELQRPQTAPAGATTTFYYWDHLGTVRMTAGEYPTAENVERHDYEPYGLEMLPATNQASNTHQFTGHERDTLGGAPSAALDYMHARFYGSNMGSSSARTPAWMSIGRILKVGIGMPMLETTLSMRLIRMGRT